MKQLQHGDVVLHGVNCIPEGVKKVKPRNGRLILADGEVTGHAHAIKDIPGIDLFEIDDTLYLSNHTGDAVDLSHEEHKTIKVPTGDYEIARVVEIDPFENEIREVMD